MNSLSLLGFPSVVAVLNREHEKREERERRQLIRKTSSDAPSPLLFHD
jgi:hypothetical protein